MGQVEVLQFLKEHPKNAYSAKQISKELNLKEQSVVMACKKLSFSGFVWKNKARINTHLNGEHFMAVFFYQYKKNKRGY